MFSERTRPLKNLMSAAGAAQEISRDLRAPLELWMSAGRVEGGGETVMAAAKEMLLNLPQRDTDAQWLAVVAEVSEGS